MGLRFAWFIEHQAPEKFPMLYPAEHCEHRSGPSTGRVPTVRLYNAGEIAWYIPGMGITSVAVGVLLIVPVAVIVPVLMAGAHIPVLRRDHHCIRLQPCTCQGPPPPCTMPA